MEFGTWVLNTRREKEFELRKFAEKVSVDASTISRIENLNTQATFYTAFRICQGFDVSLKELISALTNKEIDSFNFNAPSLFPLEEKYAVTMSQVIDIIEAVKNNDTFAIESLVKEVNDIQARANGTQGYNYQRRHLTNTFQPYSFGELERYFFDSPLSEEYKLKYPLQLEAGYISQIYEQGGVLMLLDVELFLKKAKLNKSRFFSTSSIERLKLPDILKLFESKELTQADVQIVEMIWEAYNFLYRFGYLPNTKEGLGSENIASSHMPWEIRLAVFYLTISRWKLLIDTTYVWM